MRRGIGHLRAGGSGITPTSNVVDLFIITGQSNAEGRGDSTLSPAAFNGLYITGSTITTPLVDPVGGASTGSAWPSFSNEWARRTGRKSAFVEQATGGTALLPDTGGANWSPSGTLRALAVTAANNAITAINASTYTLGTVYFVWGEGETVAANINGSTITAALYQTALKALADYFKAQVPSMSQMVVIQLGRDGSPTGGSTGIGTGGTNVMAIRKAQYDACTENANLLMGYRGSYSFATSGMQADALHYNQAGYNVMGKAAAIDLATAPVDPAISPFLGSTNYADPSNVAKGSRSANHTTTAGTNFVLVAVGASRPDSSVTFSITGVTFGGVAMTLCGAAAGLDSTNSSRVNATIWSIDAATFGASLDAVTQSVTVTASNNQNLLDWCVIDAKDVQLVDSTAGFILASGSTATAGAASLDTFAPALVVTAAISSAITGAPLTCTLTGSTELMDHGLTNAGVTRAAQFVCGYSTEASLQTAKAITPTWSASCITIATCSVAFRAKFSGE